MKAVTRIPAAAAEARSVYAALKARPVEAALPAALGYIHGSVAWLYGRGARTAAEALYAAADQLVATGSCDLKFKLDPRWHKRRDRAIAAAWFAGAAVGFVAGVILAAALSPSISPGAPLAAGRANTPAIEETGHAQAWGIRQAIAGSRQPVQASGGRP